MGKQVGPIIEGLAFAVAEYFSGGSATAILRKFALGVDMAEASILLSPKVPQSSPPIRIDADHQNEA